MKTTPIITLRSGDQVSFERRRYGRQFYTWVAWIPPGTGAPIELGDPWPCANPKRTEIQHAIDAARERTTRYRIESPLAGTTVVTKLREVSCTQVLVRDVTNGGEFVIEERLLHACS